MVICVRAELQLLYLDDVLLFLGFVLLLLLFVLPLTVVHGLCNGWFSGRGNQYEIETHVLRPADGRGCRHDLGRSVWEHCTDLPDPDCLVDVFSNFRPAWREASWWIHAGLTDGADSRRGSGGERN